MLVFHDVVMETWKQRTAELERAGLHRHDLDLGTPEHHKSVLHQTAIVFVLLLVALVGGSLFA